MTEEVQVGTEESSQDQAPLESSSNQSEQRTESEQPAEKSAPAEKMVPASKVSKIVAQQAREAAERARQEALAEAARQQAEAQSGSGNTSESMGGMRAPTQEEIRQMIRQEAHQVSNQAMAERIYNEHNSKMDAAREKYPDFDEKYESLNVDEHPELVMMLREIDNSGDVMYDLASNPEKFLQVLRFANGGYPQLAVSRLNKLSASIKANEAAKSSPTAPEPLSQIKSSNIGKDNGDMNVSDFRKQSWLRG